MNNKGLSLIEVIVSLAIIGIIAFTMMNVFNIGLYNIIDSGKLTKNIYTTKLILDDDVRELENTTSNEIELSIKITILGVIQDREVSGKYIKKVLDTGEHLSTFVP